ncbi:hypothetical protein BKA64DRAFT_714414 [Cadophora sp. MPI-SDFR-AT-0126]|nr:hypothetical protein BKA64DRAFT_714414 [Leotiomycetes sp. MPI-SDFR-AT-0126]
MILLSSCFSPGIISTCVLFAALALTELVGTLVGGLISAWLFDVGVNVTPGLPYWGSGMLFLITTFCTYLIGT